MKTCLQCGLSKPLAEFNQRQGRCRRCQSVRQREWYEKNGEQHRANVKRNNRAARKRAREAVREILAANPCADCGERDPVVLEFDHVRGVKLANVADLMKSGFGLKRILAEIAKCEVVCANCHRRRTAARRIEQKG